jgi:hypothetical protein
MSSDDPRIGDILKIGEPCKAGDVALCFFPTDHGVARNGGRTGAKRGPQVFMDHIKRTGMLLLFGVLRRTNEGSRSVAKRRARNRFKGSSAYHGGQL